MMAGSGNAAGSCAAAAAAAGRQQQDGSSVCAVLVACLCCVCALLLSLLLRGSPRLASCTAGAKKAERKGQGKGKGKAVEAAAAAMAAPAVAIPACANGKVTPAMTLEQLVPEITHHALSYLDFKSLCCVSMTNSAMRRAANDDSAWKALFRQDFNGEQEAWVPKFGWKAHYAVTRAVNEVNSEFYKKFQAKSLKGMRRLWLPADYVKCIHPGGEILSGYHVVMENWRLVFNWSQRYEFVLQDVRVRVIGDVAWVTVKEYVNSSMEPLLATNCFEYHGGQWYIVHHHSSPQLEGGGAEFAMLG